MKAFRLFRDAFFWKNKKNTCNLTIYICNYEQKDRGALYDQQHFLLGVFGKDRRKM